jgi:hypothetical protein
VTIPELISHTSSLSVLIPLGIYCARFKRLGRHDHIIGILLVVAALSDLAGYMLFKAERSTAVVFNTYYTLMFLLLCSYYYEIIFKHKFKTAIVLGVGIYVLSYALVSFYVQDFSNYQHLIWSIAGIIVIVFSITYFINSLSTIPTMHLFDNSTTWVNTGILFYFCFSLFLFTMGDYLFNKENSQVALLLWSTHNINNLIKNILFAIGLSMEFKKNTTAKPKSKVLVELEA